MRNFYVFLAILISLMTFSFANGGVTIKKGRWSKSYKRLREIASHCKKAGDRVEQADSCMNCFCLAEGVLECNSMDCDDASDSNEEYRSEEHSDENSEHSDEDQTLSNRKKKTGMSNSKLNTLSPRLYKDLRDAATSCNPGDEPLVKGCIACKCILKGIFSCSKTLTTQACHDFTIPLDE